MCFPGAMIDRTRYSPMWYYFGTFLVPPKEPSPSALDSACSKKHKYPITFNSDNPLAKIADLVLFLALGTFVVPFYKRQPCQIDAFRRELSKNIYIDLSINNRFRVINFVPPDWQFVPLCVIVVAPILAHTSAHCS